MKDVLQVPTASIESGVDCSLVNGWSLTIQVFDLIDVCVLLRNALVPGY